MRRLISKLALSCAVFLALAIHVPLGAYAEDATKPAADQPANQTEDTTGEEDSESEKLVLPPPNVLAVVKASNGTMCNTEEFHGLSVRHQSYPLTFKYEGEMATDPERKATLHEVFCMSGAYNVVFVYLLESEEDGIMPLHFAAPGYKPVRESEDYESAVLRIDVTGFEAEPWLVNSTFDPATNEIQSASKARGIGDAGSYGRWIFREGRFVLTHFEVDASYDGEINPIVIYDAAPETP
jgi:hypothetical protein